RPVTRFEQAEQLATYQKPRVALHEAGREADQRPESQHGRVEPSQRQAVGKPTENKRADGKRPAECEFKIPILFLAKLKLPRDSHGRVRERLAVHVIDGGRSQQQSAHPPSPRRRTCAGGFAHPFQPFPSQLTTRSSSAATSSVN